MELKNQLTTIILGGRGADPRRAGFSPYGSSKAALESQTIIRSQDLSGTGVTVNALLPGGATDTGMVPQDIPLHLRQKLLHPDIIMIPPT